jgi:hypothetical protein
MVLFGLLVSASSNGQAIKAELAPSLTVDPKEIFFNVDQPQSTVEISILLHAHVEGKLSYRIEAPGIEVLPSVQGGIRVGQPLKLRLRLLDHHITHSPIRIVVSGPGGVTFQQSVKVTILQTMAMKLPPKPAPPPPPPAPAPPPAAAAHAPAAAAAAPAPAPAAASAPAHHKKEKKSSPPSATSAAAPAAREFKAYWNTWSTDWQDKLTDKFDPPASETEDAETSQTNLYHFYADLSGIDFSPVKKIATNEPSSELQVLLNQPTRNTVTLQILTTVEGDGIELAAKTGWRTVRVDIGQLRRDDLDQWQTDIRAHPTEEKFFEIVKTTSALRNPRGDWRPIKVAFRATKPGCAAVALSIWDEGLTHPLDQIAWPVSVGGEPCRMTTSFDRTLTGALLDRFGAPLSQNPSAALHVFEFKLSSRGQVIAVFAMRGQKTPRVWKLDDALTDIISTGLQPAAERARKKNDYYGFGEVSSVLEQVLFIGEQGSAALRDIRQLVKSEGRPLIYARIVDDEGRSVALPLALLAVEKEGPLGRYARVLSPLRFERTSVSKSCVAKWAVLTNGDVGALPDRMKPGYPDWPNAKAYLRTACADVSKQPSEAVFLLAHHPTDGSEAIGYDADDTLLVGGLTRCYPPGSIGLFFLCQFANPKPSKVPLTCLEKFNKKGLDAAIASTFALDDTFARHFLAALERTVSELPRATTFGDVYDATVARLGKDFGQKDADEAFELALIGNPDLKICGSGNE